MKKHIIISGPQGSGKTHIAKAIEMQYESRRSIYLTISEREKLIDSEEELIVFDECQSVDEIISVARNIDEKSNKKLVFLTQLETEGMEEILRDFHVINCRNKVD